MRPLRARGAGRLNSQGRPRGPAARLRRRLRLLALPLALVCALFFASAAFAGQFLDWGDGTDFHVFGPNEQVIIDTGSMNVIQNCPTGIDDVFFPFTDIYVVPSGSAPALSGAPNTVQGASDGSFVSETIGFTAPSGSLGPGDYAVIYDECQDGVFDEGVDFIVNPAIRVEIPTDVPPLPSIAAFKADAAEQARHWQDAHDYFEVVFKLGDRWDRSPKVYQKIVEPTLERARTGALAALLNTATHYEGLAADPPDANFQQLTPLDPREALVTQSQDPLVGAAVHLGSDAGNEGAIAEALLSSLERYQGAGAANNGEWALIHAQAIRRYADLLRVAIGRSISSSASVRAALTADAGNLGTIASEFEALRIQIAIFGFSADDLRVLRNLGLTDLEISQLRTDLVGESFAFNEAELTSALSFLEGTGSSLVSELQALSTNMGPLITTLEGDASVADEAPVADAGGPYIGSEGTAISLDGSASTSPTSITAYEWDLDADADFDDGTGASPSFTYQQAFDGFVGLRVANSASRSNIDYAPIHVAEVNRPPRIESSSPSSRAPEVIAGTSQSFGVTTSDPDGDPVSVEWLLDGSPVAIGTTFTYAPAAADLGLHDLSAVAADNSPLSGSISLDWVVAVLQVDADSDGWHSNVDCDDGDPAVNPGQREVRGNGKDDDCDQATSDVNASPVANDDTLTTRQDTAGTVEVLANDSDPDSDTLTVADSTDAGNGAVACSASGSCTYTPSTGFTGADSFTYSVSDGHGGSATATVRVTVQAPGTGDTLREITAENPQSCSPFNVGLAFDGTNLLVSCVGSGVIDKIDPSDGSLVGQIVVPGESVLGALSYDRTRGKLWACTFGGAERVMLIDPADGSKDAEFASNGCGDGLAYDGDDDTLWAGADQVCDVTHYETDGTVIGAFNVCPLIGGFGKSGIAVGNGKLYVASPSLSRVYEVEQDFSASSLLFQTNRFLEDLECDDVTFAPKSAMWVQAAFDRILTAVEIPPGACPFGGGNGPPVAVDDTLTTQQDTPGNVNVLANDSDPDSGDTLTVTGSTDGAHGTVSCQPAGDCTYTPAPGYTGPDSFTYTISDGRGGSATAIVSVDVFEPASPVALVSISTNFNNPIGIDYHQPTNKVAVSVNYSSGLPLNFELIAQDGSHAPFSSISGFTDEVKIGTVRGSSCQGGFEVGELFTGTGVPGVIARIAPDGSSVANPWMTLPDEFGLMRGSLFQDRYCSFGGDLIAVTTAGGVWRVTSAGEATRIAQINTHLEGLTTVPDDPARYGPWAGKLLAGAEGQSRIYAITADGAVTPYELGIAPEDIDIVPAKENFFGVDFAAAEIKGAPASEFADKVGDVVIAQESPGILWDVHWNAAVGAFQVSEIARVGQWEHVTFAPAGINPLPPTNSAPVASDSSATTTEGTPVEITLQASDPDGDALTYSIVSGPTHGSLSGSGAARTYTPDAGYTGPDSFTFNASDGSLDSNVAMVSITVAAGPTSAELALTKADAPDPVAVGGNLTYTLTVTNNGPDPSTGSTVTDTLPAGVTFVSATPSQGSCSEAAGTVTCMLGPLAVGASATIEIVVTVGPTAVSPLSDTATVTGAETDPVADNNSATAETTISKRMLDHFKCYKTKQIGDRFDPRQVVLTDQFNTERVNVVRPEAFCNPVDKDGSGIKDPTAHLACYKIRDVRGDEFPKFMKQRVEVTDQFGTRTLLLKRIRSLCLPSSKAPVGEVPGSPPTGLDHFKCYKTKQIGDRFDPRRVLLTDQFNTERVRVVRPEAFCTPVDKDGSGINDPTAHLACYKIRDVRGDEFPKFRKRRVEVGDQFGTHSLLLKKTRTLCLPSSKTVL